MEDQRNRPWRFVYFLTGDVINVGYVRANLNRLWAVRNLRMLTMEWVAAITKQFRQRDSVSWQTKFHQQPQVLRNKSHTYNIGQYNNNRLFSIFFPILKNLLCFNHRRHISQISKILLSFQSYVDAQYQK
jgi:hypothetical protein